MCDVCHDDLEECPADQPAYRSDEFGQKFGDYLLMYAALAGQDQRRQALKEADELDEQWIDDGSSRSYLLAWLMSWD